MEQDERRSIGEAAGAERRRAARQHVMMKATIRLALGDTAWDARVRNVSATGVRVAVAAEMPEGAHVIVVLRGDLRTDGTVISCADGFTGVQFDEPLDLDSLVSRRPRMSTPVLVAPPPAGGKRPGLKPR